MSNDKTGAIVAPDIKVVKSMFARPDGFFRACKGVREDGTAGYFDTTRAQMEIALANWCYIPNGPFSEEPEVPYCGQRWVFVNKYRQAKATTFVMLKALGVTMFTPGINGVFIADTHGTASQAFERAVFAHRNLPDIAKLQPKRITQQQITWPHGGTLKSMTARTDAPGIGRSLDFLVISELCAWRNQAMAAAELFPAISKRQNAICIIESTPGRRGSHHEAMWQSAWKREGRFGERVFLEWWKDPTCMKTIPDGHRFDNHVLRLADEFKFLNPGNLFFMEEALHTEFAGDIRLFRNKYPMSPHDGWLSTFRPIMPEDAINELLDSALPDPKIQLPAWCGIYEEPEEDRKYVIFADPNSYGPSGDPSAMTVFDAAKRKEVAVWSKREDPGRFATRLMSAAKYYNDALIVVESNAAACIATLRASGYPYLYWTNRQHPGWYTTTTGLQEAEARLIKMLREKDIHIVSYDTLIQGLSYDGTRRDRRITREDGTVTHHDRWMTIIMAADIFSLRTFSEKLIETKLNPDDLLGESLEGSEFAIELLDRRNRLDRRDKWLRAQSNYANHYIPMSRRGVW